MGVTNAYEEVIDFIAVGTTPEAVAAFCPSDAARVRVADLLARERVGGLTTEEKAELEHCAFLEHLMRLAKARARLILKGLNR